MSVEDIRRRLKCEEGDVGIRVFVSWVYWKQRDPGGPGGPYLVGITRVLKHMPDDELELLWARFMMEASEEDVAACAQVYEPPEKHDSDCCCGDCKESRAAEAEYYAEMKQDR